MIHAPERAHSIDEVLAALDTIVADARRDQSRLGFFAVLYRKVTRKVKEGIADGFFENGPRMERLDVTFANRYLAAYDQWQAGTSPTAAWRVAFEAARSWRPIVLQHLLLGMNAHINLDLGIAAATVAPGAALPGLKTDFERINEILFSLVRQVQTSIGEISPWIAWVDGLGGKDADVIVRFSLEIARCEAWDFACELAPLPAEQWDAPVDLRDRHTTEIGRAVRHPGWLGSALLLAVRLREVSDVGRILDVLEGTPEPGLVEVEASRLARNARQPSPPRSPSPDPPATPFRERGRPEGMDSPL